ncbi:MAG: hypothetical protein P4L83_22420 [Nevskia sp.]|nr:hypothetical protein [Nevskia sp.]
MNTTSHANRHAAPPLRTPTNLPRACANGGLKLAAVWLSQVFGPGDPSPPAEPRDATNAVSAVVEGTTGRPQAEPRGGALFAPQQSPVIGR